MRLALWHFHQITLTWAEFWTSLLIVIASFGIVALGALIVNLFRAPGLLDQEMAGEIVLLKRDNEAKLAEIGRLKSNPQIFTHKPLVVPLRFGGNEYGSFGLFVTNDRYAAYDVSVPDVPIGTARVTFKGKLTRLADKEEEFFDVWIEHSNNSGTGGSQLSQEMFGACIPALKVGIVYKDGDIQWYRSNCVIERDVESAFGLSVSFVDRESIPAPPSH